MSAAVDLLYALVLESGRRWGEVAQPWQRADAEAFLDASSARRFHWWGRPRGAAKTADAGGVASVALLEQLPARSRSYALAGDRDQAALVVDSIAGFAERTPEVGAGLRVGAVRVAAARSGATLTILASDAPTSWGIRPHLVFLDEFGYWPTTAGPKRLWRSIFSALPKVPRSRLVIATSASDPSHFAAGVLKLAKEQPGRWRVSEVPGPCPWISDDDLEEQRRLLPSWEFERLHLNRWTESEDRLTNLDDLAACVVLDQWPRDATLGRAYAMGVDVGLKNDRTVCSVCSVERGGGSVALDRMEVWQGSRARPVSLDAVEAWLLEAWAAYQRPPVVCDPYQSAQLMERLRRRRVRVVEHPFTSLSVSRLALRLHQLIADQALELPDDPELLDELGSVRLRETSPNVYRLDHDAGRHDDRAISIALAAQHLLERAPRRSRDASLGGLVAANAGLSGSGWRSFDREPNPRTDHWVLEVKADGWERRAY